MSKHGDRFLETENYTGTIAQFIEGERDLLSKWTSSFDVLIEVGCMNGRYLNWTIANGKHYVGLDIVDDYIKQGIQQLLRQGLSQKEYQFVLGDAIELSTVIRSLHITPDRALILFPFNCFGNIVNLRHLIFNLRECSAPFLISSYQTSPDATSCRYDYYKACGYSQLRVLQKEQGVCITSLEGLHSTAYQPEYLQYAFREQGMNILSIPFSSLGIAYARVEDSDSSTQMRVQPLTTKDSLDGSDFYGYAEERT